MTIGVPVASRYLGHIALLACIEASGFNIAFCGDALDERIRIPYVKANMLDSFAQVLYMMELVIRGSNAFALDDYLGRDKVQTIAAKPCMGMCCWVCRLSRQFFCWNETE